MIFTLLVREEREISRESERDATLRKECSNRVRKKCSVFICL